MTQSSEQQSPQDLSSPSRPIEESTDTSQSDFTAREVLKERPAFVGPIEWLERVRNARGWVRDHLVAVAALSITLLAAGGYSVHRSWLFGWYNAAKVPPFAHSWSVQDLVMLGVVNLDIWAEGLLALTLLLLAVYWLFAAAPWMEQGIAYLVEKAEKASAKKERPAKPLSKPMHVAIWFIQHALVCAWLAMCVLLLYLLITFAVLLLASNPQKRGYEAFQGLQAHADASFQVEPAMKDQGQKSAAIEYLHKRYSHVSLAVDSTRSDAPVACGWLVLQNGEHVLLLTRDGPTFISTTGLGFSWKRVDVGSC